MHDKRVALRTQQHTLLLSDAIQLIHGLLLHSTNATYSLFPQAQIFSQNSTLLVPELAKLQILNGFFSLNFRSGIMNNLISTSPVRNMSHISGWAPQLSTKPSSASSFAGWKCSTSCEVGSSLLLIEYLPLLSFLTNRCAPLSSAHRDLMQKDTSSLESKESIRLEQESQEWYQSLGSSVMTNWVWSAFMGILKTGTLSFLPCFESGMCWASSISLM